MVLAWSAADAIRYLYFATRLVGGHQYSNLTWLRYSAFYVLYPVGIASEVGVVYATVSEARRLGYDSHAWAYIAAALLYIPGKYLGIYLDAKSPRAADIIVAAPTLFNHMRRQRRKVLTPGAPGKK